MNFRVCCFNNRFLLLLEVSQSFNFGHCHVNEVKLRQTDHLYPSFIQNISIELEKLCQTCKVVSILYQTRQTMRSNFPNGIEKIIRYHIYYTAREDCDIDNVFYDELLDHLMIKMRMSYYVSLVFLQSLRNGFNRSDSRVNKIISENALQTHHDYLSEVRRLVLNLTVKQKKTIEIIIAKNSTFNSVLPNMILLNVTNCVQQESLSIKHSDNGEVSRNNGIDSTNHVNQSSLDESYNLNTVLKNNIDDDELTENDIDGDVEMTTDGEQYYEQPATDAFVMNKNINFKSYGEDTEFQQHFYYCSYKSVIPVKAELQLSTFNNLIAKNIVVAFFIKRMNVDQLTIVLYVEETKIEKFSKIRVRGKILQYIQYPRYIMDTQLLNYDIELTVGRFCSTAPFLMRDSKSLKDTFKSKVKLIQIYLILCTERLRIILKDWRCICKVLRIVRSPYNENDIFLHTLIYINDSDTDFLYKYLPENGMDSKPCRCHITNGISLLLDNNLKHSQKMWLSRPCIDIHFHTHFDWTIQKIHNDTLLSPNSSNIFKLYDIHESPNKLQIAHLLDTKVFKTTIENMTTFKFYLETGLLYPSQTIGNAQRYVYTLMRMTRVVYRCIVLPLMKLEKLSSKSLLPSKYTLTYSFVDDPLTPTTSVRGPQSARNLKSVESDEKLHDTNVTNVAMLLNSYNMCGCQSIENVIKM